MTDWRDEHEPYGFTESPVIKDLQNKISELTDEIELLRSTVTDCRLEIERIRAERDEARRMYCKAVADHYEYACNAELDGAGPYTQKDVAKDEGWDCFKEDGK